MTWVAYSGGANSIPILAGGNIVTIESNVTSGIGSITASSMTPAGVATFYPTVLFDGPQSVSNIITDGVNVYVAYRDIYPRDWFSYWDIATFTFNANLIGSVYYDNGLVLTASNKAVVVGADRAGPPSMANYTLPATAVGYNNFAYTGEFGHAIFDGSSVWTMLQDTTTLFQLDPTSLTVISTHTLSVAGSGYQMGYDGSRLYIAVGAGGTGLIVFDLGSLTGTVYATGTAYQSTYYSANLGLVVTCDGAQNIYTVPIGGGATTNIGNTNTITGIAGLYTNGFCDGPAGNDLWANCVSSPHAFNIVYTPGGMRIVGII